MGSTQPREDKNEKVAAPVLKTEINGRGDPLRRPRDTLYPQKLALTSPTSGGRSVGIVRLRTTSHGVNVSEFPYRNIFCRGEILGPPKHSNVTVYCCLSAIRASVSLKALQQICIVRLLNNYSNVNAQVYKEEECELHNVT
jgi:hypothetical protein